jgi:cation transport ATPase/YHS domain-containing protein
MSIAPHVACPGCGQPIDPLRAGHVAVFDGKFEYFCRAECKREYVHARGRLRDQDLATASPPEVVSYAESPSASSHAPEPAGDADVAVDAAPGARILEAGPPNAETPRQPRIPGRNGHSLLIGVDAMGIVCGVLAPAIGLLGAIADSVRLPLVIFAWLALLVGVGRSPRDPADPQTLVVVGPTTLAVVAACWAQRVNDPRAVGIAVLAGLGASVAIIVERLVARARFRIQGARRRVLDALDLRVRVIHDGEKVERAAAEVRPGEQVVVDGGEFIGVDATVTAGEAHVVPWLGARIEVLKREGNPVVAGARVTSSGLRMTTTWSGRDRAWIKLLAVPSARIDVAAPTVRTLRHVIERGVPAAGALVGVAVFAGNATPVEVMASVCAAAMAFGVKAVCSFVGLRFARAHLEALASGIAYKDARAFERAGSVDIAIFSARGTVLLGEPEIVAVENVGPIGRVPEGSEEPPCSDETTRVLALAAGAETASSHPFASAVLRAARVSGVRPDAVRNATVHAGLGVTALSSTGKRLVVGGRAIMLEEKIGVALADTRVSGLEAEGRSVLLVALGERVIGLIALQDGLRAGARAAVQTLLDARIEPVLLSGEARETCETIGRALDIDHVRPEVLPGDRGAEVRALAEGGSIVGVIGHPAMDDGALGAADVAVAMGAAGSTPGEWAVALASDDVRHAALALAIPRAARGRAWGAIALGAIPGTIALLAIAFGVAPLAIAPLATLFGALAVAIHAKEAAA